MDDEELARLREQHVLTIDQVRDGGTDEYCKECEQDWPCPVAALLAEVDRLRALLLDQGRANARLTVANAQLARRLSSALGEEVARD